MSELEDLYQQVILDHNRKPRNYRKLEVSDRSAEGYNPLCGDQITLYVNMDGEVIREIAFQGNGCAISKASASIMTDSVKGKTRTDAEKLFAKVHKMLTAPPGDKREYADLGKLAVFAGVSQFPVRVKCASLAWHTLSAALEDKKDTVSTE